MHVLITGVGSFIGSYTIETLTHAGFRVTGIFRSENIAIQKLRELHNAPELIQLDLGSQDNFNRLPKSIDAVVHVAGLSSMPGITMDELLYSNINGTRNIQQYALSAGARCLVFTSSISVYGNINNQYVDETTPIIDPGVYGASKYIGERLLAATADFLPVAAIRLPGVLGPGASRAWIPTLLNRFANQQNVQIFNPEAKFNNAIHVLDLSNFILTIIAGNKLSGFHAFPLASSGTITIREVAEYLKEATKSHSEIIVNNSMKPSFKISSEYAITKFNYCPRKIQETLKHFIKDIL